MTKKKIHIEFSSENDDIIREIEQKLISEINKILKTQLPRDGKSYVYSLSPKEKVSLRLTNMENTINQQNISHRVILKTSEKYIVINRNNIIHLQADNSYTSIYLEQREPIIVSRSIKYFEGLLCDNQFIRTHRSHIVNINKVVEYIKTDGGSIVMDNGDEIPISKNKKSFFLKRLINK